MSITKKTSLVVGSLLIVIILLLVFYFRFFVLTDYLNLEEQYLTKNIEQSLKVLNNRSNSMFATSQDWANWDDTYNYISDVDQAYADSNLSYFDYANLKLNFFALIDN